MFIMSLTQAMSRWKPLANGTMESMICSSETVQEVWSSRSLNAASLSLYLRSSFDWINVYMYASQIATSISGIGLPRSPRYKTFLFSPVRLSATGAYWFIIEPILIMSVRFKCENSNCHDNFQTVVRGGIKHYHAQRLHI